MNGSEFMLVLNVIIAAATVLTAVCGIASVCFRVLEARPKLLFGVKRDAEGYHLSTANTGRDVIEIERIELRPDSRHLGALCELRTRYLNPCEEIKKSVSYESVGAEAVANAISGGTTGTPTLVAICGHRELGRSRRLEYLRPLVELNT